MKKTLLVHDYFAIKGGGERLSLTLANAFAMDLLYGLRTFDTYDASEFPTNAYALTTHHQLKLLLPLLYATKARAMAAQYQTRIFTGNFAPLAAPRKGYGRNIQYINTPPRPLYDQYEFYRARAGLAKRTAIDVIGPLYRYVYEQAVAKMDVHISNSHNIKRRVQQYLGIDSHVVYPPVAIQNYQWNGQGDYYLSTARLTPLKRVDVIVDAFMQRPHLKLVVASGGGMLEELQRKAAGNPNITFTGWLDDVGLQNLMGRAIASIYIPRAEDFGISPIESMAAGKPVIGVADGGILETMRDKDNGILLPADVTSQQLADALDVMTPDHATSLRRMCEEQAQLFSNQAFIDGMAKFL